MATEAHGLRGSESGTWTTETLAAALELVRTPLSLLGGVGCTQEYESQHYVPSHGHMKRLWLAESA